MIIFFLSQKYYHRFSQQTKCDPGCVNFKFFNSWYFRMKQLEFEFKHIESVLESMLMKCLDTNFTSEIVLYRMYTTSSMVFYIRQISITMILIYKILVFENCFFKQHNSNKMFWMQFESGVYQSSYKIFGYFCQQGCLNQINLNLYIKIQISKNYVFCYTIICLLC